MNLGKKREDSIMETGEMACEKTGGRERVSFDQVQILFLLRQNTAMNRMMKFFNKAHVKKNAYSLYIKNS